MWTKGLKNYKVFITVHSKTKPISKSWVLNYFFILLYDDQELKKGWLIDHRFSRGSVTNSLSTAILN